MGTIVRGHACAALCHSVTRKLHERPYYNPILDAELLLPPIVTILLLVDLDALFNFSLDMTNLNLWTTCNISACLVLPNPVLFNPNFYKP